MCVPVNPLILAPGLTVCPDAERERGLREVLKTVDCAASQSMDGCVS
jgi:hypothetical protein